MKEGCGDPESGKKCRLKCHQQLSVSDREYAHNLFWQLGDRTRQWECLNNWMTLDKRKPKKKSDFESDSSNDEKMNERKKQHTFRLPKKDGVTNVIICKDMLLDTLWVRFLFYVLD